MTDLQRNIILASDHAGFALKKDLKNKLQADGYNIQDLGPQSDERVDYPDFGHPLAKAIQTGAAQVGIAICGSGIGISMAINRHKGVRAAVCINQEMAQVTREHNDSNVLCLGARFMDQEKAYECAQIFLKTEFENGRHTERVRKIDEFEE